jgi:hypothetical protein
VKRPFFPNPTVATLVGLGGFALAWFSLHDAFEARGTATPKVLRPFTWW